MPVPPAGLEKQNAGVVIFAQPRSEHAAGGPAADDHIVELFSAHGSRQNLKRTAPPSYMSHLRRAGRPVHVCRAPAQDLADGVLVGGIDAFDPVFPATLD